MEQAGVQMVAQGANAFDADMASATKAVAGFGASVDKSATLIQDASGRWRTASGRFASDAEKAAAGVETVAPAAKQAGDAAKKAGDDAEKGGHGFDVFGQIVIGALRQVGQFAVQELGQALKATAGFVKDSIGAAGDFEAGMNKFRIAAGAGVDTKGLAQFKDLFISLGRELPVSTKEVEDAATEMVTGGIDPAIVAAGGLRQTIQFAAAAQLSLTDAAEVSAKVLAAWTDASATAADKTAFLTSATDTLVQAAAASSTNVAQLRLGLFNVGGAAQSLGVTFRDTTATLALLAPAFSTSADAGTSLKTLMQRLVPSTKPATAAMEELGLITKKGQNLFFDAQGGFLGMANAAELLKDKIGGLSAQRKIDYLHTIFGTDAQNAANVLVKAGAAGIDDMTSRMDKANGVQAAAAITQQGYNTALENAKGSVEALQITLGTTLLPMLTDLLNNTIAPGINTLTTFASALFGDKDAFDSLSTPLQNTASYVKDVAKAFEGWYAGTLSLSTALTVVSPELATFVADAQNLAKYLQDNISVIEGVAAAFGALVIISTVVGWVEGLIASVAAVGAAFTAAGGGITGIVALLGGPVTLAIAGVAAAIGLLVVAWQNDWGGIQEKVATAWAVIQPPLAQLEQWLATNIPVAVATVSDALQHNVFPVLKDLADVYLAAASTELQVLSKMWEDVLWPALKLVWGFLKDSLIPIIVALVDVNLALLQKAGEAIAGIWQKVLLPAFTAAGNYISATFGPAIKEIGDWMSSTFGPTLQNVKTWLSDVTGGFTGITGAVQGTITYLKDLATSITNLKLPPWATPGSPTPWEIALRGIGDALQNETVPGVNAFGFALSGMGTAAAAAATDVTGKLGDALKGTTIIKDAKTLGTNAIAGLVSGMESNLRAIDKVAGKVADKVSNAFAGSFDSNSPAGLTIPFGASLIDGLILGIQQTMPGLTGLVESLDGQLTAQFSHVSDSVSQQISDMVKDIQDKVKSAQDAVNSLVASGFGATASISRQVASNLGAFTESTNAANAKATADALAKAETEARAMTDPEQGAKYFEMRSKQILELASLQKSLATQQQAVADSFVKQQDLASQADQQRAALAIAASDAERQAILAKIAALNAEAGAQVDARHAAQNAMVVTQQQLALIGTATDAEIKGFAAQQAASGSATSDVAAQIREILNANLTVKGKTASLPGIDDPTVRQLNSLLDKLTSPAASPTQIASSAQYINNSPSYSYNLGIQTNNSPAALQQSFAVMAASTP